MSGQSKRSLALALASFAAGVMVAGVLGNPKTLARITEGSKDLVEGTKRLAKRTRLA